MPKSKRSKLVTLSKTKKQGRQRKDNLIIEIREAIDRYESLYVFETVNMRNTQLKNVRSQWKDSRFFFGKNKVMAHALGRTPEEEYKENLHQISERISGSCGLLFTNQSDESVKEFFTTFREIDYARAGFLAEATRILPEGPMNLPHPIESHLRSLGMQTILKTGVIYLVKPFTLCEAGKNLTPEQAKVLKLLDEKLAEFHFSLKCKWDASSGLQELN